MAKELSYPYMSLVPHLQQLRFTGLYELGVDSPKLCKLLHNIYSRFVYSMTFVHIILQLINVYQVRADVNKVIDTMFILLTYSDYIIKALTVRTKADRTEILFNTMKGPVFNREEEEYRVILKQKYKSSKLFLRVFNFASVMTALLWMLYPTAKYLQDIYVEFEIWLPFDANRSPTHFYAVIFYLWIQNTWVAWNNSTMDAFMCFLLAQSKTQISILRLELENVVQRTKQEAKSLSKPFDEVFQKHFYKILFHYKEILNFENLWQNNFGGCILVQFLISGWIICTTAYRLVNIDTNLLESMGMLLYIICIIVQLYLYCYMGNEVSWESECIIESVCEMEWLQLSVKQRKDLIIFMERIKRPFVPMAGTFVPLSNATFVSIMRSSYTFFVFLKNTN